VELEDDWHKVVGGKKNQADFGMFSKLIPSKKEKARSLLQNIISYC